MTKNEEHLAALNYAISLLLAIQVVKDDVDDHIKASVKEHLKNLGKFTL